EYGNASHDHRG
ncbi:histidine kinase-, DNA gyrase B-, and HSP90-like ATPase family protein, partial [Vibrio harveyi]